MQAVETTVSAVDSDTDDKLVARVVAAEEATDGVGDLRA